MSMVSLPNNAPAARTYETSAATNLGLREKPYQGTAGMRHEESQSDQVEHDQRQCPKAVCKGAENR
jgi:hypothetical protein